MDNFMNPLNKLKWRDAVKRKAPQVVLTDGSRFSLVYTSEGHKGSVVFEPIAVGSTKPLVPRGTLDIETMLADEWLEG